jgi:hypothetical protein
MKIDKVHDRQIQGRKFSRKNKNRGTQPRRKGLVKLKTIKVCTYKSVQSV